MPNLSLMSLAQLERAVSIKKQIEALRNELNAIEGNGSAFPGRRGRKPKIEVAVAELVTPMRRRKMSADARARIAAAQKARWAKAKGTAEVTPSPAPSAVVKRPKKTRKMSPEAKAKIAAAAKERWARVKAQQATA